MTSGTDVATQPGPEPTGDDEITGLAAAEVAERVAYGRTNAYQADSSRSIGSIIRANVFTIFNAIVGSCFAVLLLLGRWQDAIFGLSALANTIIGVWQEFRAKAALDRLALLNAPTARVLRDGVADEIHPTAVVIDDILVLRAGDQIAADAEVIHARGLQVDESMLTGESDAVDKRPGDEALSGSIVVAGEGMARVIRVGADSYANRFAAEAKRFSLVSSELRSSINLVLRVVGWAIGPMALLVLNAQMMVFGGWVAAWESGDWVQAAVNTIAAVTAKSNGDTIVYGITSDILEPGHVLGGSTDLFLALYSRSGDRKWLVEFGGAGQELPSHSIALASNGDIIVAGRIIGDAFEGYTTSGLSDVFVARLTRSGHLRWVKQFGSVGDDRSEEHTSELQSH